jgi:methyl-accepting chemotaxis protein
MRNWVSSWALSWRIVAALQLVDTLFSALLLVAWASLLALDLSVVLGSALVVTGLRWGATAWRLRSLLHPTDDWRAALEAGDHERVRVAHEALQRAPGTAAITCGVAWAIAWVVETTYVWLAMGDAAPIGVSELQITALLVVALFTGSFNFVFALSNVLVTPERAALSVAAAKAGLKLEPHRSSLGSRLTSLTVGYALTATVLMTAVGWANSVAFDRYHSIVALDRAVSLDASRIAAGLAPERSDVVGADALTPGVEAGVLDSLPPTDHRITIDRRRDQVSVAAQLSDDRWLLAEQPVIHGRGGFTLQVTLFGLAMVLAIPASTLLTIRSLLDPLRALERATQRLVDVGDVGDVGHLPVVQDDEIGAMTHCFNRLVHNLRDVSGAALAVARGDLTVSLDHPGDLSLAFRGMLEQLHEMVVRIRETAVDVASASSEIYAAAQEQETAAARSSDSVNEMSATVESLAESAKRITATANGVLDNAEQTLATTDVMTTRISELTAQANGVGDLLEIIREVADRSDLLALNGSLEATRAGEAGRGFALVAAEMRRLAERVTGTVADVRERVSDIKSSGSSTVMATEQSRKLATDTASAARQIVVVTRTQSEDTGHAANAMQSMSEFVIAASVSTTQTRAAAEGLRQQIDKLDRLTRQFQLRAGGSKSGAS